MNELEDEKRFYDRFWNLLNDRQLMQVFERFGPAAFRRSSVLEGFEAFMDAQDFRGHTVVEIGTCKGLTACVLARRFTRVVTIDIVPDPQREEIAALLGLHNIVFMTVRDNAEKAEALKSVPFDAAFVDGDHARDTASDFMGVQRCGRVLFHEHWPTQPAVITLVNQLRGRGTVAASGKWALWTA